MTNEEEDLSEPDLEENEHPEENEETNEEESEPPLEPLKLPFQKELDEIKAALSHIKHKIIVSSGKGGVGKSTVVTNLAASLAVQNLAVGILDIDITGPTIPKMLGLDGQRPDIVPNQERFYPVVGPSNIKVMSMAFLLENADVPVIWRGPLKIRAIRQFIMEGEWDELDYLIIDLPPGTGDEVLEIMQLVEDAGIVIVTTPQEVAMAVSRKSLIMAKQMNRKVLGVIENMSGLAITCPHCGEEILMDLFGSGGGEQAALELAVPFLGKIPIEPRIRELGDAGMPFVIKDPESASSKVFESIVQKIRELMEQ
jgi:Mrp family chromosome partitioning ATPase